MLRVRTQIWKRQTKLHDFPHAHLAAGGAGADDEVEGLGAGRHVAVRAPELDLLDVVVRQQHRRLVDVEERPLQWV